MSDILNKNDWRLVIKPVLKFKYEMKSSYQLASRNRITRLNNFGAIRPGSKRVRAVKKILIAIDTNLLSQFNSVLYCFDSLENYNNSEIETNNKAVFYKENLE